jgi:Mannosyltransferase (PIG-V)
VNGQLAKAATSPTAPVRHRPVPWRRLVLLYAGWAVAGHVVMYAASNITGATYATPLARPDWLAPTTAWDGGWYWWIAEDGYAADPRMTAFFPVLPALLGAFGAVGIGVPMATLVITTVAAFVAVAALHELVADRHGDRVAWRTVVLFLAFPWSLFLYATYTEALVCALGFGSFLAAQRRRWVLAFVLAGIASGCRLPGVFVGAFVVLLYLRDRGWSWRRLDRAGLAIPLAASGLLAYMAYLEARVGNAFDFLDAYERAGAEWHRDDLEPNVVAAVAASIDRVGEWWRDRPQGWADAVVIELTGLLPWLGAVVLAIAAWWRRTVDRWWTAYAAVGIAAAAVHGIFVSANRYLLPLFGLFAAAAVWVDRRPRLYLGIVAASAALLGFYTARFGAQLWAG